MGWKILFSLLVCISSQQAAFAGDFLGEFPQPLTKAFIPDGFDNDDSIQFVVAGTFPSNCFQGGPVHSEVVESAKRIELKMNAYEYKGDCKFKVPFYQTIYVGRVKQAEDYTIVDANAGGVVLGTLKVREAPTTGTTGTDNKTYAPLLDAYVKRSFSGNKLVLTGVFPADMKIDKVKIEKQDGVLLALPYIVKRPIPEGQTADYNFEEEFPIKEALPEGRFLLHVRSMGGQAINKIIPN